MKDKQQPAPETCPCGTDEACDLHGIPAKQPAPEIVSPLHELRVELERVKEALRTTRKAFVVACGDKSPYMREALAVIDAALK